MRKWWSSLTLRFFLDSIRNEGLHDNKPSSTIQVNDEEVDTLLNVSQVQDQEFVSQSFGPKYRIALEKEKVVLPKANDPILEKAIKGYTKDTTKMDVFTAEDKVYAQQVNWSLSHNVGPSELKKGTPEQAPTAGPKVDDLLNVASKQDQEFISLGFGAKSRQ